MVVDTPSFSVFCGFFWGGGGGWFNRPHDLERDEAVENGWMDDFIVHEQGTMVPCSMREWWDDGLCCYGNSTPNSLFWRHILEYLVWIISNLESLCWSYSNHPPRKHELIPSTPQMGQLGIPQCLSLLPVEASCSSGFKCVLQSTFEYILLKYTGPRLGAQCRHVDI